MDQGIKIMFLYESSDKSFLIIPQREEIEGFVFVKEVSQVYICNHLECNAYSGNIMGKLETFIVE